MGELGRDISQTEHGKEHGNCHTAYTSEDTQGTTAACAAEGRKWNSLELHSY